MKYLGIDYGKKKIGLALSEGLTASPYKTLSVSSLKDAVSQVSQIIKKEEVGRIIIGIPESGEALKITKNFIQELKNITPLRCDIVEVEETLSSYSAKHDMLDLGFSKKDRQKEDAYSAMIILQDYLDSIK